MAKEGLPPELVIALRQASQKSGQSLNQLSTACGVDRGRLSRFMRAERDLTLHAGGRLCEALGIHFALPKMKDAEATDSTKQVLPEETGQGRLRKSTRDNASAKRKK